VRSAARGAHRTGVADPQLPRYDVDPKAPFAHPYFWAPLILMGNWL
jgi:CHAT domain-containing protein